MTLDEFRNLDPAALWAGLTPGRQASIIVPLLTSEFATVCAQCDGTDCSSADRDVAAGIHQDACRAAMDAIDAAFPDILASDPTARRGA